MTVWRAMAGNPLVFLRSGWPWRSVAYLAGTLIFAAAAWVTAAPLLVFAGVPVGAVERRRLGIADPHPPAPAGLARWARQRLGEAATWRELGYAVCLLTVLPLVDATALGLLFLALVLLAAPLLPGQIAITLGSWPVDTAAEGIAVSVLLGMPATVVALFGVSVLAGAQAEFARWLLGPELSGRVVRLVDAFEAERRRIERDLHDGAQQHLLLLSMNLGLARREIPAEAVRAGELVREAHEQARLALDAIREQIRGIHPQVLTDFGLAEAVRELAGRCTVPVVTDVVLPGRLPDAVESTAYFVVSEALTNVVRHAEATRISIAGRVRRRRLRLTVTDDGRGGADPENGTGMRGLADRVAVLDGTFEVDSPPGGPTVIRMELPCG